MQQFAIGGNDSTRIAEIISPLIPATDSTNIITKLTEEDFERVAKELEIEVATIKAVVDIEAGVSHNGFVAPGQALINFDLSVFKSRLKRAGINPAKYKQSHPVVFARPNTRKYGSYGKAQYARLNSALTINEKIALESCFWGMFQIGGFNWKMCGCSSPEDFHNKINQSEAMQLELFANFITSNGLVKHLRNKNWRAFARGYNGASYAKRGYHTRMANSYRKHAQKR
ncbi:MAG: N-acetylmuramidase family protein [Bacteroidaceae bacterium]|nr:N-acetylmuramidase family protein [Bacteroidaceae bacterium]